MVTNFFKWNTAFETGITIIDTQHKVIVKTLNELYDIIIEEDNSKIDNIIIELLNYTDYHFNTEEKLFEKYKFPEETEHKLEHKNFIEKINEKLNKKKSDDLAMDLLEFLKDWLVDHILVTDQKYAIFFKNNNLIDEINS